jgi:GxxExxY protein
MILEGVMECNELTYQINGAVFEVNRTLGSGFLEKVYENALVKELTSRGLSVQQQVPVNAFYKGTQVGDYFVDILVEGSVIMELKAVDALKKVHVAQLLNYLKATESKIGFLVNFTYPKAEIKRFVF